MKRTAFLFCAMLAAIAAVAAPAAADGPPAAGRFRGVMLRGNPDAMTEDDFATLGRWGANLVRFQMPVGWRKPHHWESNDDYDAYIGSYLSPAFAHHRIPRIEDVFTAMEGRPERLCFVDEKGFGPAAIAQKAREYGVLDQVYYTGMWYDKTREWVQNTGGKTMFWIGTWPEPTHDATGLARFEAYYEREMDKLRAGRFAGISLVSLHSWCNWMSIEPIVPGAPYLQRLIDEFHAHGIPVATMPFEGGEKEETYLRLRNLGFDAFSTDHPGVLFRVLRQLQEQG